MEAIVSGYYLAHLAALLLIAAALQRRPRIIRLLTMLAGIAALVHFIAVDGGKQSGPEYPRNASAAGDEVDQRGNARKHGQQPDDARPP